ncbi:hypothetical protein EVAR_28815_1 [Eumeta japonica]|uniref:Uncharacterized protein n=1 Tax=Eumeta variegata TaxID=151549 RepID=A0A4C1WKI5_EUMVA|nr:hypothetical protein EVAR_28815_1 [Eumeta japonica]
MIKTDPHSLIVSVRPTVVSLSLFNSNASADRVEERSLVLRSCSHARLRRNATMSHTFSKASSLRALEATRRIQEHQVRIMNNGGCSNADVPLGDVTNTAYFKIIDEPHDPTFIYWVIENSSTFELLQIVLIKYNTFLLATTWRIRIIFEKSQH